jgi:hypothetical protein
MAQIVLCHIEKLRSKIETANQFLWEETSSLKIVKTMIPWLHSSSPILDAWSRDTPSALISGFILISWDFCQKFWKGEDYPMLWSNQLPDLLVALDRSRNRNTNIWSFYVPWSGRLPENCAAPSDCQETSRNSCTNSILQTTSPSPRWCLSQTFSINCTDTARLKNAHRSKIFGKFLSCQRGAGFPDARKKWPKLNTLITRESNEYYESHQQNAKNRILTKTMIQSRK